MRLSLAEVMNLTNGSREYTADIDMKTFSLSGEEYEFIRKEPVHLKLTSLGNKKVLLEASADLSLSIPCSRCLEPVETPFHIEIKQRFDFSENLPEESEEADDDVSYVIGYDLDVDMMISEEIMLEFPMKVLCSDDCKGLCKICGANLNEGECGCDRTELDPRMSVIRDLFKDFN